MTRRDRAALILLAALPFLFLCGTLTSRQVFFMRDLTYLFHPWRALSSQMLQQGEMPLWNSYQMGGMPFLANCQSAVLYPFTGAFAFFGFPYGLKFFHYFHYALAGIGFFLLCRVLKFRVLPSAAAGALFAFNGYALTRLEFLSVLGSYIWLPWILLLFCARRNPALWSAACAAIAVALSFFAGFPQIVVLQTLAAAALLAFRRDWRGGLRFALASGAVCAALAAAQWIPTVELIQRSIRGGSGLSLAEAVSYSLPIDSLPGLVYPFRMLHHPDRFTGEKFFWIWSAWWGIAASVAAMFAWFGTERKRLLALASLLFAGAVLWAMGDQFPGFEFLYRHVFIARFFRYPPVALYLAVAGVAVLAAMGWQKLASLGGDRPWLRWAGAALFIAMIAELGLYSMRVAPTISPEYYGVTYKGVRAVQQSEPGKIMLSPKVNQFRRLPGMNSVDARMRFRAYLFDATNLPYRIKSILKAGEPLALRSYENLYVRIVAAPSLREARQYLDLWNVTHLVTHDELDATWEPAGADGDIRIYRNPSAMGEAFTLRLEAGSVVPGSAERPKNLELANSRLVADFDLDASRVAVMNLPYYPGWKATDWADGGARRLEVRPLENYFAAMELQPGRHRLYFIYDPWSFRAGAAVSVLCAIVLAGCAFIRLRRGSFA